MIVRGWNMPFIIYFTLLKNYQNKMSFRIDQFNERTQARIREQLEADIRVKNPRQVALLECDSCNAPLAAKKVQGSTGERFLVRIGSRRKRLIDQDNLCEKFAVDLLRYSQIIPDDSPDKCQIEVSQTKCRKGEQEEITITVTQL